MKSQRLQLVLGIAIAVVALVFTFRGVSFREVFATIKTLRYAYFSFALVLFVLSFVLRAYRWRQLLITVKPVPVGRLYSPLMIGFMGNLLPLRAGEFIRAFLLGKKEETGFSSAFATIVVERLFDLVAVLVIFAGLLLFDPGVFVPRGGQSNPAVVNAIRVFGAASLAICLGVAGFAFLLIHQQDRAIGLVNFFTRFLPERLRQSIEDALRSFTAGLGVLRDPRGIGISILFTAVLWAVIVSMNYPLYYCYGIEGQMPVSSLVTLLVLTAAAVMIPTPGFVGPWQFAVTFVLSDLYGVDRNVAVSFSLISWFLQMVLVFLSGFFFLVRDNVSLMEMSRTARGAAGKGGG
jgi:glycosyltransferase 2 family protein